MTTRPRRDITQVKKVVQSFKLKGPLGSKPVPFVKDKPNWGAIRKYGGTRPLVTFKVNNKGQLVFYFYGS